MRTTLALLAGLAALVLTAQPAVAQDGPLVFVGSSIFHRWTNLAAQMAHLARGGEAIMPQEGHVLLHEAAGHAVIVGASIAPIPENPDGTMDLDAIAERNAKQSPQTLSSITARIVGKDMSNTALASEIKQSVDELKKLATERDVRFLAQASEQPDFGFGRYIHNPGSAPKRDFQKVDQQRLLVEFLFKELVESRPTGTPDHKTPLMLLSLARVY